MSGPCGHVIVGHHSYRLRACCANQVLSILLVHHGNQPEPFVANMRGCLINGEIHVPAGDIPIQSSCVLHSLVSFV